LWKLSLGSGVRGVLGAQCATQNIERFRDRMNSSTLEDFCSVFFGEVFEAPRQLLL
jgi:hypothetical protein